MRCEEVAACCPPRSTATDRWPGRCAGTSSRACAARPSSPGTAGCSAPSSMLRTRYPEPTPGLLATLASIARPANAAP